MKINFVFMFQLIIIGILHYYIVNHAVNLWFSTYFKNNDVNRSVNVYDNEKSIVFRKLSSGYTETITILFTILYYNKYISLPIYIFIISFIFLQTLIYYSSVIPSIVGIIFGLIYSLIYIKLKLKILYFIIISVITTVLILSVIYNIDPKVKEPIPNWVDENMFESIRKKQNIDFYLKFFHIINTWQDSIIYISWKELENYLEMIITKIKDTGIKYDAIVGIKTGGAILSDYISKRLNIPNYKIKLSDKVYNCNKKISLYDNYLYKINRVILKKKDEYDICERITEDIHGKNVILIDECVGTGKTMLESIHYLKKQKQVKNIYPICISLTDINRELYNLSNIERILSKQIFTYPWGYDC